MVWLCVSGGYGWNQGIGALSDGASEEAVLEWFTDEVANAEFNINARGTAAEQVRGKELRGAAFGGVQSHKNCRWNVFVGDFGKNFFATLFCTRRFRQAGRQLGKRHLQKLLLELGRGCLQGASTADEKVIVCCVCRCRRAWLCCVSPGVISAATFLKASFE